MLTRLLPLLACLALVAPAPADAKGPVAEAKAADAKAAADALYQRGLEVYRQEGPKEALVPYERALAAYRALGDRLGESIVLGRIGNCHKRLGDYPKALELLGQALEMKRELDVPKEIGITLNHQGLVHWETGDYELALAKFTEALAIAEELQSVRLKAALLNNLGLVNDEWGRYRESIGHFERASAMMKELGDRANEAATLSNIGGVHYSLGDFREAIAWHERSLAINRELELKPYQSQDLGNIALCRLGLDEIPEALELLDAALKLARETGLKKEEADWLRARGGGLAARGDYSDALESLRAARDVYRQADMKRELIEAVTGMAELHLRLGDVTTTRRELERAITLAESIGYPRGSVAALALLGDLAARLEQREEALSHYARAHALAAELGDKARQAHLSLRLGRLETERGNHDAADAHLKRALEVARRQGMRSREALALFGQGESARQRGRTAEALALYDEGIELAEPLGNPDVAWQLHHGRARALAALKKRRPAIRALRRAVEHVESVRSRLREDPFRSGYLEDKHEVYVDLVHLLLKIGQTSDAFTVVEKSRARAYLDLLERGPGLSAIGAGREHAEERELRSKIEHLSDLLEQRADRPTSEQRDVASEALSSELTEARRRYSLLLARLRSADPDYASIVSATPLDVTDVQGLLGAGEALVEYFLADGQLTTFVVTPAKVAHVQRAVRARSLTTKVELLRDRLRPDVARADDWKGPAESLRELLIAPLEDQKLLDGVRVLHFVPQGVLHYLPFAALWKPTPDGGEFLVESHDLSYLPSATTLASCRRQERPKDDSILALAPASARLRHSQDEARAVVELFEGRGRALTGGSATEEQCKRHCGDHAYLHFATHGRLNKLNPLFSSLELERGGAENGRLEVFEILGLRLRADLVTLSACNTALGAGYFSDVPAGDDWVGLTRAFLHAGTPSVVAALWEVDDRHTRDLMRGFYGHLGKMDKAAALARAQRELIGRGRAGKTAEARRSPYHWAGFVLVGDPR